MASKHGDAGWSRLVEHNNLSAVSLSLLLISLRLGLELEICKTKQKSIVSEFKFIKIGSKIKKKKKKKKKRMILHKWFLFFNFFTLILGECEITVKFGDTITGIFVFSVLLSNLSFLQVKKLKQQTKNR